MMIAAPSVKDDGGNFSADSPSPPSVNSDDEQLDDVPFLSHQLPDDHESFSEKFLRNILTHDYQNLMPRRREKFVEITKTVTVTEIVNGAPDKHPSSCEVKVTNVSPAGPHPVNVSIKHLHEKWHSCEELDGEERGRDLGKGTIIHIHETHKPFNYEKRNQKSDRFVYEDVVNSKVDSETRARSQPPRGTPLFNRSSDNVIDLEFRHPILVETSAPATEKSNGANGGTRRRFADLRKKVSTTTKTSMTETEKVTTTRRSSSAHSTSSRRSYGKPEVRTLYYRKFVEEDHKKGDDSSSDSGSVIIRRDSVTRRSQSADPLSHSPVTSPVAPPRKRLGREESLHYYRDDEEVLEQKESQRRVTVQSPEPRSRSRNGNTSVSMNDTFERQNLTAGITSISMNNSCTDTSFESRFSTIPRARSSPPSNQRINHIHVNVIGPSRTPESERRLSVVGRVGDDVTMDIFIERHHRGSASSSRRASASVEAPPKPPRRSKWEEHHHIGEPLATSTPMTTIERKQTREERISTESGQSSRKSTRSARPPDINIIECETILRETRSPARTPATPIVVINQTPSSRRSSQDLLGDPSRRRKSTVTDIDWYAAFNMKDPSSPTKPIKPPFGHHDDERKTSRDIRRRASDSSMIGIPPADIDLNQIFSCTSPQIKKDEKCQCNACRLIRMSEAERASKMVRESRTRQSRSYRRVSDYEYRSSTLPSRHRTAPVEIRLEDVFNPKPTSPDAFSKPPTPPNRRRHAPHSVAPSSSVVDESPSRHTVTTTNTKTIDRSQVTPVTTNSRDDSQLHASHQLLSSSSGAVDWVGQMMHDANEWENKSISRKSSTASSVARKASVARRISVDELTKPEKRKSKNSVSLPPSDVTIDDIFTALTQKKEDTIVETEKEVTSEKKTFIVTRKQRAQDVDPIDFEKDQQVSVAPVAPVVPPRTKKSEDPNVISEATVLMEPPTDNVISTASVTMRPKASSPQPSSVPIDLDNVFSGKDTLKRKAENTDEDEKIKRRVAEFEKSQQEKLASRSEETTKKQTTARRTSWENSNISMDDVFNADGKQVEVVVPFDEPSVESTATIQLEPVELPQKQEPEQVEETKATEDSFVKPPEEDLAEVVIEEKPKRTSAVSIDLDSVFVSASAPTEEGETEEDKKIRRRIAEFQKSQQDKERQTEVVETHSSHTTFDESNISMDDVFNSEGKKVEVVVPFNEPSVESTAILQLEPVVSPKEKEPIQAEEINSTHSDFVKTPEEDLAEVVIEEKPKRTSAVSIDLDSVFVSASAPTEEGETEEDKKIRRRIAEFQKSQQDKERQTEVLEIHSSHATFDESNISMDDVFNTTAPKETKVGTLQTEEVLRRPTKTSSANITLDDLFVLEPAVNDQKPKEEREEEERIKTRIAEFEKAQEETIEQASVSESHEEPAASEEPSVKRTSAVSIDLDAVFVSGSAPKGDVEDEEDKKIQRRVAEFEKSQAEKKLQKAGGQDLVIRVAEQSFDPSDISMDVVFNAPYTPSDQQPTGTPIIRPLEPVSSLAELDLSDVFDNSSSSTLPTEDVDEDPEEKKMQQKITKAETTQTEKTTSTRTLETSDISMDAIFSAPTILKGLKEDDEVSVASASTSTTLSQPNVVSSAQLTLDAQDRSPEQDLKPENPVDPEPSTSSADISLDDVFSNGKSVSQSNAETDEDKRIRQRISEFQKAQQDKESRVGEEKKSKVTHRVLDDSHIPMDDVFSFSSDSEKREDPQTPGEDDESGTVVIKTSENETTKTETTTRTETSTDEYTKTTVHPGSGSDINLDDVFSTGSVLVDTGKETEEDKKIRQRIAEFKKSQQEKEHANVEIEKSEPAQRILDESDIPMSEVFGTSSQSAEPQDGPTILITSEEETTKTGTTTRTESSTETYTKKTTYPGSDISLDDIFTNSPSEQEDSKSKQPTLEDLFGPQTATPTAIPTVAITSEEVPSAPESKPQPHKSLSNLLVPGKWNESMMSTTSTISLDDSFNNSFAISMAAPVEPKMRKPLSLPVNNWIDDFVAKTTDEATREAPKTPKTPKSGTYFPSPTRISQEIKYEWVADLVGVAESKEDPEGDQTDEKHLQTQDSTWVSSVVYRPTLETSAYTLRASQVQPEQELDMDKVFSKCLMSKKKDDEKCECTACRITEKELEEMQKRKIEKETSKRVEETLEGLEQKTRHLEVTDPADISIDEIFNPEVPLHIHTEPSQIPSTSSPPLENTRTYYLSPKISETVTTTHQWKDADISIDEIFSPVSSTTNENRRFSNFYEDRSGWDTIGSEDSGVMSGGDRGRRRSSRTVDRVIDEAFKGIFDTQPTSSLVNRADPPEAQYDDFYITSLNEGDIEATDSEVDGENLDVTQFVDDILGKSLDEAAFLSSTKSLRDKDHTDTSIDRKKSGERVHPYYRTRTDTSMDKRSKPAVITEDQETHESHDEIMKLVFVDRSLSTSTSRGSLSRATGNKPNDEELLEIEIKPDYFLIKGSYSLLIPKSEPLGQMLQKLRDQNDSLATLDFSLTRKLKKLLVNCIREKAGNLQMASSSSSSSKYEGLSSRGQSLIESVDHASATFLRMNVDKFEPTRNPQGIVNFCTAENNICTPLLEERFKHLELFFPNTEHLVRYPPAGGWPEAREVLVKYFKEFMSSRVPTEELVLTASTRTGYDVVSYCLFEQDDVLLTNGPVYTGTISNVQERALCQVECVPTDLSNPRLEVKKYEEEFNRQTALDNVVAGVIIVNPHNPLGVVFPPEDVVNLCNWAASKNLHVVIDEVFANCVFDKASSKFRPFLSYRHRVHRPENVAWLWSVSKDFGLPGLKFAVIHSANEGLRQAAMKLQFYHPCSPFVQDFAVKLLSDSEWLREFHTEVTRRMAIHYRYTAENLKRLEIPFVPAQAGIFVFADFSKHLSTPDEVGELALFERLGSAGVMLTPGTHQKCHVFGWFRLVFACTKQELEEGFRRLYSHLGSQLHPVGSVQYN